MKLPNKTQTNKTQTNKNVSDEYDEPVTDLKQLQYMTIVYHDKFGEGMVNSIEGFNDDAKIKIYFYNIDDIKIFKFSFVKNHLKLKLPF